MSQYTEDQLTEAKHMKSGILVKPLYVRNFSLGDWELLESIKTSNGFDTHANALRYAVRKAAGKV